MLRVEKLIKKYDHNVVLDEMDLTVKKGEVYGFIGKNGAGKTTTINCILSLIHKNDGAVYFDDEKVSYQDVSYKRKIGYVPDVPVFPNYLNASEYLQFVCKLFSVPKNERETRIDNTLSFVGLRNDTKTISGYSRGMKQRLAIAQALIHDPEFLIMDEPTSALDPKGRKEVIEIIKQLKGKKTIFYSTHILEDVEKVCDRIGLLNDGKILLEDSIEAIKDQYYKNQMLIRTTIPDNQLIELIEKKNIPARLHVEGGVLIQYDPLQINTLLQVLYRHHIQVETMQKQTVSLEDVFMEVTNA